jgi:hypothetical protein
MDYLRRLVELPTQPVAGILLYDAIVLSSRSDKLLDCGTNISDLIARLYGADSDVQSFECGINEVTRLL